MILPGGSFSQVLSGMDAIRASSAVAGASSGSTFAADFGVLYRMQDGRLNLGGALQHLGPRIAYIDEEYNAQRLTQILTEVAGIIGANILNVAHQDYDPQGASVTMLIAENKALFDDVLKEREPPQLVAHLDKSHVTVQGFVIRNFVSRKPHRGGMLSFFRIS